MNNLYFSLLVLFSIVQISCKSVQTANSASKFYAGKDIYYGEIYFTSEVFIPHDMLPSYTKNRAAWAQLEFIAGAMMNYGDYERYPTAVYGREKIVFDNQPVTETATGTVWRYHLKDRTLFRKKTTKLIDPATLNATNSAIAKIDARRLSEIQQQKLEVFHGFDFVLPLDPSTLYKKTLPTESSSSDKAINPCSDPKHNSEREFYYYWNADLPGCPIKDSSDLVVKIHPEIVVLPQTKETYPDYTNMYGSPDASPTAEYEPKDLHFAWAFGNLMRYKVTADGLKKAPPEDPYVIGQRNVANFLQKELGYKLETTEEITFEKAGKSIPFTHPKELYKKTLTLSRHYDRPNVTIHFRLYYGAEDTALDEFFLQEIPRSTLFIYDGHSRLGGLTAITKMKEKVKFTPNMFQTFYFAGCRSFAYYNARIFESKPENLNIITNTNPPIGGNNFNVSTVLIKELTDFSKPLPSWQAIIDSMNAADLAEGKRRGIIKSESDEYRLGLIAVNGDENNAFPVTPFKY